MRETRALSDDDFVLLWTQLMPRAERLARKAPSKMPPARTARTKPRASPAPAKPRLAAHRTPGGGTYGTYQAKAIAALTEHPEGLKAAEVGQIIGQRTENAHGTLKNLEVQQLAFPHKVGTYELWTLKGVTPEARMDTTPELVRAVLTEKPGLSLREIRDAVLAMRKKQKLEPVSPKSVSTQLWRMAKLGEMKETGAGPYGPTFELPQAM